MFYSHLKEREEQVKERLINRIRIRKNEFLFNLATGFPFIAYFNDLTRGQYFFTDLKNFLTEDPDITSV